MLARTNRFSFKSGMPKRFFSAQFFVIRHDSESQMLKCAVVVGKKVDKRAVIRNKIKRQLVAHIKELVPAGKSVRIVLIARPQIKEVERARVREELEKALRTIHIL